MFKKPKAQAVAVQVDPERMTVQAERLEQHLTRNVIGQERAIRELVKAYENYEAGINDPTKPLASLLFLGPTGSGKTRSLEVFCEYFWGKSNALIKIDCAEFTHSHELSKIIGSPPGYLGHKETQARICKQRLEEHWTDAAPKFSVILFDEIEKAHPDFHQLMLGVMDKGILTLGNNDVVDLKKCFLVMTSNLGAKTVAKHLNNQGLGYTRKETTNDTVDQAVYKTSMECVKKFFEPEFINRIDRTIVFRSLSEESIRSILDIELDRVQRRLNDNKKFIIVGCSKAAKDKLIEEGINLEFGARELRRAIERFLVNKLSRIIATKQVEDGDLIQVDYKPNDKGLSFSVLKGVAEFMVPVPAIPEEEKKNDPLYTAQWEKPADGSVHSTNSIDIPGGPIIYFVLPKDPCIHCGAHYLHRDDCPDRKKGLLVE